MGEKGGQRVLECHSLPCPRGSCSCSNRGLQGELGVGRGEEAPIPRGCPKKERPQETGGEGAAALLLYLLRLRDGRGQG